MLCVIVQLDFLISSLPKINSPLLSYNNVEFQGVAVYTTVTTRSQMDARPTAPSGFVLVIAKDGGASIAEESCSEPSAHRRRDFVMNIGLADATGKGAKTKGRKAKGGGMSPSKASKMKLRGRGYQIVEHKVESLVGSTETPRTRIKFTVLFCSSRLCSEAASVWLRITACFAVKHLLHPAPLLALAVLVVDGTRAKPARVCCGVPW